MDSWKECKHALTTKSTNCEETERRGCLQKSRTGRDDVENKAGTHSTDTGFHLKIVFWLIMNRVREDFPLWQSSPPHLAPVSEKSPSSLPQGHELISLSAARPCLSCSCQRDRQLALPGPDKLKGCPWTNLREILCVCTFILKNQRSSFWFSVIRVDVMKTSTRLTFLLDFNLCWNC